MSENPKLRVYPRFEAHKACHCEHTMSMIQNLLHSLRTALTVQTPQDSEEQYLSGAVDHADLERRIAFQSRAYMSMAPMNIGR